MPDKQVCPECGGPLTSAALGGLCPKCIGQLALRPAPAASEGVKEDFQIAPAAAAGTRVRYFGNYELLQEVARGGMGIVFKARQASLKRVVALKMILKGELASPAEIERFHVEAQAAANLQHPNIVAIHEVGEHEGQHYFSMDFVDGKNLAQVIAECGVRSGDLKTMVGYVKTVAEAIHYAHQHGTIHRDLKPSNILIDALGQPRITDFGLAKRVKLNSDLTASGQILGTPNFMPPEQVAARQGEVGPQSDVYSLGATIFDLLTKPDPVLDDDQREIVKASAKRLLVHLHDKLVLDWRRKANSLAAMCTEIRDVLDADLPADPYPSVVFDTKVQAVFDHIVTAYGDNGERSTKPNLQYRRPSSVAGWVS